MTHPIGETAGKVWKFLDEKGEVTLNQMKKGIKADPNLIPQAIGWLAREDKLIIGLEKGSFPYLFLEKMNGVERIIFDFIDTPFPERDLNFFWP